MNHLGSIPGGMATLRLAADGDGIAEGARLLAAGLLVALPTETVYGLGADATDARAVAAVFSAKERPRFNPLIAHVANLDAAKREGLFDRAALALAEAFWPGPLTLVVPASEHGTVCELARAGLPSVALRIPGSEIARRLLADFGRPVAAPSANRSGRVSPTSAAHVLADLDGRIAAIIDGGPAPVGVESTVVACLGGRPRLLRPGGVTREAIEQVLGSHLAGPKGVPTAGPLSPGMLASHYAPRASVRLDAVSIAPGEAALLFGKNRPSGVEEAVADIDLSPSGDLAEAAAGLFAALRRLDASGAATIAVVPIPRSGLGEAINDRLERAAAPR
ncbi:MAG: threonylcarbamoyl-AMP synthase [Methylobacterium sp.]|uniref:L-threonylcarbamoyladenylate synthase n=1 Tax=Methylobacterium sp. TaxID=409 RepID=UPI0025CDE36A|nr:L-threonylcarbamoyladenylate synthase [Methylobacterium sp.]MBX9932909.1 threonylcarbamoyl-AMP synthase [Methylobacterium sp.]